MILLYYIGNTTSRFGIFVANRISEIRECSTPERWNHVIGSMNPADLASRPTVFNVASLNEWFNGSMLLKGPKSNWSKQPNNISVNSSLIERKSNMCYGSQAKSVCRVTQHLGSPLTTYFSSWPKLIRPIAWPNRFERYIMVIFGRNYREHYLDIGLPRVHENGDAEADVIKIVQKEAFPEEIESLAKLVRERPLPTAGFVAPKNTLYQYLLITCLFNIQIQSISVQNQEG